MEELKNEKESELRRPIYQWVDITSDFFESVQELALGELFHHEFFGLFE
jgi:hypothetical protein